MENPPFWRYLPGKMGMFMGYVSFREGNPLFADQKLQRNSLLLFTSFVSEFPSLPSFEQHQKSGVLYLKKESPGFGEHFDRNDHIPPIFAYPKSIPSKQAGCIHASYFLWYLVNWITWSCPSLGRGIPWHLLPTGWWDDWEVSWVPLDEKWSLCLALTEWMKHHAFVWKHELVYIEWVMGYTLGCETNPFPGCNRHQDDIRFLGYFGFLQSNLHFCATSKSILGTVSIQSHCFATSYPWLFQDYIAISENSVRKPNQDLTGWDLMVFLYCFHGSHACACFRWLF